MAQEEFQRGAEVQPQTQPARRASSSASALAREAMAARNRMSQSQQKEGAARGGAQVSGGGEDEGEGERGGAGGGGEEEEEEEEVIRNSLGMAISRRPKRGKDEGKRKAATVPTSTSTPTRRPEKNTRTGATPTTSGIQLDFTKDHAKSEGSGSEVVLRNSLGMIIRRSPVKRNVGESGCR